MMQKLQSMWLGTTLRLKCLKSDLENDERGVTAIEYAVMLVLVAIAIIILVPGLRDAVVATFQRIRDELNDGLTAAGGGA